MIDFIRGKLSEKEIAHVALEAHGVGYAVSIPLSTYEKLPEPGSEVVLKIHYHVREDAHKLFGFFTVAEREVFRLLLGISKIGPKVALNILSGISISDLALSVNSADPSRLEKVPGVGAKTAQRLVLELKGKVGTFSSQGPGSFKVGPSISSETGIGDEAFAAMISLGYNEKQVTKALSRVEQIITEDAPVEEWIRKALQVI